MKPPKRYYSLEEKTALINRSKTMEITLNGKPAAIGGRLLDFAVVGTLDLDLPESFQWAWATVERILNERNGQFKS